jgi:hypothetical protein
MLSTVDVIGCAHQGRFGHDVYRERGDLSWRAGGARDSDQLGLLARSTGARRDVSSLMPPLPPITTTVCPRSSGSRSCMADTMVAVLMIPSVSPKLGFAARRLLSVRS